MAPRFTEATNGPMRRTLTYVAIAAAVAAILSTVAMIVVAFGALPPAAAGWFLVIWVGSLLTMYLITRYLKSDA